MKAHYLLLCNLSLLAVLIACNRKDRLEINTFTDHNLDTVYTIKVIGNDKKGWGYEIYKSNRLFIDQPTIPAVGKNRKFISYDQALKVGELVMIKLYTQDKLPTIFIEELDSLKISY